MKSLFSSPFYGKFRQETDAWLTMLRSLCRGRFCWSNNTAFCLNGLWAIVTVGF